MKVLVAGATGLVGVPVVQGLLAEGDQVTGIVRSQAGADLMRGLGANAVTADLLDRDGLLGAVRGQTYDAVVHEGTSLKKAPARFSDMTATNELRTRGTTHLLEVARAVGATRFLTQSIVLGYGFRDHGTTALTEDAPFGRSSGDRFAPTLDALAFAENEVFSSPDVEGVALRYGLFYGRDIATVAAMLRKRRLPVTSWEGPMAFVHHDDAAAATIAALRRGRVDTAYNIVDDTPTSWRSYARTVAAAVGAPAPLTVPAWLLRPVAPYAAAFMSQVAMNVSNARARTELGWTPRYPSCVEGTAAAALTLAAERRAR
jgi:nucleoside-diphosphate-sugar epimerase